ncbi:hypothetical protein [Succinimonas sp.]|uniref:hypothetical protein n=1 Tax=Succinimonas sp. TaxID=1936151 RepID=UPI00386C0EF0
MKEIPRRKPVHPGKPAEKAGEKHHPAENSRQDRRKTLKSAEKAPFSAQKTNKRWLSENKKRFMTTKR